MTKSTQTLSNEILSDLTVFMKYARYLPEKQRRENWEELTNRNKEMHQRRYPHLRQEIDDVYRDFVLTKKVLPSMRALQFGGNPIELNEARQYNCSFAAAKDWEVFHEAMFLLLSGCGFGFSVQQHHVDQLPAIKRYKTKRKYLVSDDIEGWANSIQVLMKAFFFGKPLPQFDYGAIREKGAKLITSGGKAPGADPLRECHSNLVRILERKSDGEQLTSVEVHDLICFVADAVLAGGIRRAALISLFSSNDDSMLVAKSNFKVVDLKSADSEEEAALVAGQYQVSVEEPGYGVTTHTLYLSEWDLQNIGAGLPWWHFQPQRGRANNSVVMLRSEMEEAKFRHIWKLVEDSKAGEPGVFLTNDLELGTNPCAEISLHSNQFCNLTTINTTDLESQEDYNLRARAAAFIGTLQAGYTNFHFLRPIWREVTEREALLGVSMTGIGSGVVLGMDMAEAASHAKEENARVAELIQINPAARVTTVKPEGTASLVCGSSSGIHAWFDKYYIRRIRVGKNEAMFEYLSMFHPELVEDDYFKPNLQAVISIPQKAPENAIYRTESALDTLERVKKVQQEWIQPGHRYGENFHNVSATINIKPDEWSGVVDWAWENRDLYTGISVLDYDGGTYVQAPFESCDEETYLRMMESLTNVDLSELIEEENNTNLAAELACASGGCEIQ